MANSKITDLAALTGASLAASDVFEVTDVSDTSMDASGTSKKITVSELDAHYNTVINGLLDTQMGDETTDFVPVFIAAL
jgi:hypothetical protein